MPVEFALRPRIRLREDPAPARRVRPRLPKFALPALTYWLVIGGLVYEFVHHHAPSAPSPAAEAALAPLLAPPPPVVRPWWRPLPAPVAPQPSSPSVEPPPAEPESLQASLNEPAAAEPPPESAPASEAALAAPAAVPSPAFAPKRAFRSAPVLAADPVPDPAAAADPASAPAPALALVPVPDHALTAPSVAHSLPSCEGALASASQDVDFTGGNRTADLPTQAIAAVLENGAWLSSCAVPEHTALDVCVAIKGGRVVGASVTSQPADSALNQCVKRRASSLQFPYSPHLDLARTRF